MGCKISSTNGSSQDQESESACSESSNLLVNDLSNGSGYGIERLTDSPSPDRRPVVEVAGENAASGPRDSHTARNDVAPHEQKSSRRNGIRTEEVLRGSQGSSGSEGSLNRYTEPVRSLHAQHREHTRQWGEGGYQPILASNTRQGMARTPPLVNQLIRRNSLKLGGAVEADGMIRVPPSSAAVSGGEPARTQRGKELMEELSKAYKWREQFKQPSSEFLALMDRLYMECQLHLTVLSSRGDPDSRREADAIVSEMVALRNYWGPQLLPSSTCNAFVRERIPLTLGVEQRQFRIDCAQFFEPVPFYGNQQNSCPGELMKLYRFSVYSVATNEVVLRYYLERSNVIQLYHVLCFTCENYRGQVRPYGTEPPTYWEVRQNMLEDVYSRLMSGLAPSRHRAPKTRALYPPNTMGMPAHLQVTPVANTT